LHIELLANFFLEKYAAKYRKENISLSPEAAAKLKEKQMGRECSRTAKCYSKSGKSHQIV
jgi:hypothetical protein